MYLLFCHQPILYSCDSDAIYPEKVLIEGDLYFKHSKTSHLHPTRPILSQKSLKKSYLYNLEPPTPPLPTLCALANADTPLVLTAPAVQIMIEY